MQTERKRFMAEEQQEQVCLAEIKLVVGLHPSGDICQARSNSSGGGVGVVDCHRHNNDRRDHVRI